MIASEPVPRQRNALRRLVAGLPVRVALAVITVFVLLAVLAPWLPLADPAHTDLGARLLPPGGSGHLLGTDRLGRDLLSRLLDGVRLSLVVALLGSLSATALGSAIGLAAGYRGGWFDAVAMRLLDVLLSFPYLLLAIAIVAALGPGLAQATVAIAVANVPFFARTVRGVTLSLKGEEFVLAARVSGASESTVALREILPNVLPTIAVAFSTSIGWVLLETAGLSFLGLGAQPPEADLGGMLGEGRELLAVAPHVSLIPGFAILVLVAALNVLGDGLRDALDPRDVAGTTAEVFGTSRSRSARAATSHENAGEASAGSLADGRVAKHSSRVRKLALFARTTKSSVETHVLGGAKRAPLGDALLDSPRAEQEQPGDEPAPALLRVRDLSLSFGAKRVLDRVCFELEPGERVALVGASGSGKSLTARALLGLLPRGAAHTGEVQLDGVSLLSDEARARALRGRTVALVPQDPQGSLHPLFPVEAQLGECLPGLDREARRARIVSLLASAELPNPEQIARRYPHELSGGMRQRVAIAMALSGQPKLLVLDEPTTALDVTTQASLLRLLRQLSRERGVALLFVTHDLAVASELCERVLVMNEGRIVEAGDIARVFEHPEHPATERLVAAAERRAKGRAA